MTTTTFPKSRPLEGPRFRARINWPLLIGLLLVGSVIYLAVVGPSIAPHDPLEENLLIKDARSGEWHIPPFPAFEVTGYPLGSDEFGRDLYSRLLWAIRPTLQMVGIVAMVRLVLGALFGLIAGWSTGRVGSFFDTLISGALALPGLLVALGTIAVVGVEFGLIAFVIGLSVTGWAETARIVREQTRTIKSQVFIEAAHALGASDSQIVFRHVFRQIQALLLMLLAFEVGSTLMLTAGLGFLGYYIGGDVWVDVSDFVARRTSGTPELGQMLATAWVRLTDPWGLVSVGTVVFAAVLGFNLIGEGLRLRLNQEVQGGVLKWLGERTAGFFLTIEHYITYPTKKLLERPLPFALFRLVIGIIVGATAIWGWEEGWFRLPEADVSFLYGDSPTLTPFPTQAAHVATPTPDPRVVTVEPEATPPPIPEPTVIWEFETGSIFTGAPVIAPDGTIYATTSDNLLHALAPDGSVRWQYPLPARPVDTPALAADGTIFVTDNEGSLNAISPQGEEIWRFVLDPARSATSSPTVGPNGNIYYALGSETGMVQAVSPTGDGLWLAQGKTFSYHNPPQVSADDSFVFLWSDVFSAADGTLLEFEFPSKIDRFVVGNDGKTYFRTGHNLVEWQWVDGAPEILQDISWNYPMSEETLPQEAGVTRNQISWELYTSEGGGSTGMYWVEVVEGEGQLLGGASAEVSLGTVVYMDDETLLTVLCGFGNYRFPNLSSPKPQCNAIEPGEHEPIWQLQIDKTSNYAGAAYEPETGRIYITTKEGILYAADESPSALGAETTVPAEPGESGVVHAGNGWSFDVPEPLYIAPLVHHDGSVYLLTNTNTFYILNPDGTMKATLPLPEPVYVYQDTTFVGGGINIPIPPILAPDGSVGVTAVERVYSIALDGSIQWEFFLDAPPFAPAASAPDNETFFQIDRPGTLYAFSPSSGLLWKNDLPEGLQSASPFPVFGPNSEIYYTITNGTKGMIEALNPDGSPIQRIDLTTFSFFRPIEITPDGIWLVVDDNVINTSTGRLVEADNLDFHVEEFAMGYDGKKYLIAGSSVIEWEVGASGLQIVNKVPVTFPENRPAGVPASLSVSKDSVYWIRLFAAFGSRWINLWVNPQGEVLGLVEVDTTREIILNVDEETNSLSVCTPNRDENQLECRGYANGLGSPAWELTVEGLGRVSDLVYLDGRLYAQVDEDTVQVVEVVLP